MEASVAGQPPAVAEEQAAQAVQAPAQPTEQVAQEQGIEQPTPQRGMEGAFADMKASFDAFMQSQKPAEEESLATDLLSALETGDENAASAEEQTAAIQPETEQGLQSPEAQAQLDEAHALVAGIVQEQVAPLQRELAARDMKALGDRYPDIMSKEVMPKLTTEINDLVALTGNPNLIYNAQIVEKLYKAVKAELADAAAVPAEQAATQGASLETHAGQTQAGNPSLSDTYKSEVYRPTARSVFG